ncbi:transcriptional regulator [Pedobacter yulinensis]|uniref:Transcriptional regulator n=1 Tax=Pedobacter yulinensis TaxID=2126353 RepID=A0A2T3HK62_9SPHI|nr:response regulator [Pedobacter yulinensis]PST82771.1 transcriptional regulator [Pedobacter yulinensis]
MKTILIIEDNEDIREGTAEILELSGYKALVASNGREGVEKAVACKPDLILCDIMMPELDGYGVLYLLGKNAETTDIPFIFLTAKADRLDFRKGMEMGADDYLTKPFLDMELLSAIESRLAKKERQQAYQGSTLAHLQQISSANGKGMKALREMIAQRKVRHLKKKQVLYYAGDQPLGIYLVLEGNLKTSKIADDGRELTTGMYGADEILGIDTLLLNGSFTDTAEALEPTAVCLLPKDDVIGLLNKYPDVGHQFLKILSKDIHEKAQQLLELAYHSVRKRLAQVLVRLAAQHGENTSFRISREELGALAGMATETVSRTLTDFTEEGLIGKNGTALQILSVERLQKMKN